MLDICAVGAIDIHASRERNYRIQKEVTINIL